MFWVAIVGLQGSRLKILSPEPRLKGNEPLPSQVPHFLRLNFEKLDSQL